MIEDGLGFPLRGDDWVKQLLIGGIMVFFSWLFVPGLIFTGYLVRVLAETVQGSEEPPDWSDMGELLVEGIKATVVGLVYSAIPTIVVFGLAFVFMGGAFAVGDSGGAALFMVALLVMGLLVPVMLVVYYLVPAALAHMAVEGRFGAAFAVGEIKDVWLSGDYVVAILAPLLVGVIANVVASVLSFTIVGYLLVPFVTVWSQVAVFRMFGRAYANQRQVSAVGGTDTPGTPA